jgi:hypothetical protein
MNPRAIEGVEVVSDGGESIGLRHPTRGEVQLRGVAAAVWRQADGSRSVEELATAVNADASAVWAALDELGDADLLTERAAPPAGVHESVQREVVFTGEAAAGEANDAAKLEAQFDADAAKGEQDIKLPQAEQRRKQAEEARQDAEEKSAETDALAQLDSRGDGDDDATVLIAAHPAEAEAQAAESQAKQERLAAEVDEREADAAKSEETKKSAD